MATKSTPTKEPYFLEPFIKDVPLDTLFIPPARVINRFTGIITSGFQRVFIPRGKKIRIVDLFMTGFTGAGATASLVFINPDDSDLTIRQWAPNSQVFAEISGGWESPTSVLDTQWLGIVFNGGTGSIAYSISYEFI